MQTIILRAPRAVAPIRLENWMNKELQAAVGKLNAEIESVLSDRAALLTRQAGLRDEVLAGNMPDDLPTQADALRRDAVKLAVREAKAIRAKSASALREMAHSALDGLIEKAEKSEQARESELRKACEAARMNAALTNNAVQADDERRCAYNDRRRYINLKHDWRPMAEHEQARLEWLRESLGARIETPFL